MSKEDLVGFCQRDMEIVGLSHEAAQDWDYSSFFIIGKLLNGALLYR